MQTSFYLKTLLIQNFATFKNQSIKFKPGLNVIVGETGSGKSLVLDALQFILGARADKKIIRRETGFCLLEACFHCADEKIRDFFQSEGFPIEGSEVVIKRIISSSGGSKIFVNHSQSNLQLLTNFAKNYIDLVGQFENQKLLSPGYQLSILDHYGEIEAEADAFQNLYRQHQEILREKSLLEKSKTEREQRLDYLNYQIEEIERISPSQDEEESLKKKKEQILNMEKSQKLHAHFLQIIDGEEGQGLRSLINQFSSLINRNRDLWPLLVEKQSEALDNFEEITRSLSQILEAEVDPEELSLVMEKLDDYQKLKRKFGGSIESILQTLSEFLKEKSHLEGQETNLSTIDKEINDLESRLNKAGSELHRKRKLAAKKLETDLTKRVRDLRMKGATLRITLTEDQDYNPRGKSKISFEAETNPGEGFYAVKEIASGGELSRILLSLRQVLKSHDSIGIFLFDEIDTGIGGETSLAVGKALKNVASDGQVIAITHLPQIAQYADVLIVVDKETQVSDDKARTESMVREIHGEKIKKEVRSMVQLH